MKTPRWLLPFTHGVDMRAIEYAVRPAESTGATLIPVSLISAPPKGASLEHIQLAAEAVQRRIGGAAIGEENTEHFHRTSSE